MFYLYEVKDKEDSKLSYSRKIKISLAGNTNGVIVKYLRNILVNESSEPYDWHIPIKKLIKVLNLEGDTIIIDAKPKSKELLSLYSIDDIWGYSDSGWTPILLKLKEIVADYDSNKIDRSSFEKPANKNMPEIFSFLYLQGTVKKGKIVGSWNFPGASPTNSAFLYNDALQYFLNKIKPSNIKK